MEDNELRELFKRLVQFQQWQEVTGETMEAIMRIKKFILETLNERNK